jgi:hypothetical protein
MQPATRGPQLRWAWATTATGVVLVALLFAVGERRVVSPGDVASVHAPIDGRCAQCHTIGRAVSDLRCERCHDPAGTDRLTHAAHVFFGSADAAKADAASSLDCVTCHTDHRGSAALLARVDDRECGQCHTFSSLGSHPEFAIVRAQIATGSGMRFDHDRHLVEVAKAGGQRCEACHAPTADLRTFEPPTFDQHCASCHSGNGFVTGETDPMSPEFLIDATQIAEPSVSSGVPMITTGARGRLVISQMRHRDPWVLYNARRLRRMIDPDGERAEQTALRSQIAYLSGQLVAEPLFTAATGELELWRAALEQELAALDRTLATPSPAGNGGLEEMSRVLSQLVQGLTAVEPAAGAAIPDIAAPAQPAPSPPADAPEDARRRFDDRRTELIALLDAIAARGDPALAARARDLRARVENLRPGASEGPEDTASLLDGLRALDDVFRTLRAVPDPQAAIAASQASALRDAAHQQISGGLPIEEFEERRRELLEILDAVEARGNDALAGRVAVLRQRVIGVRPGGSGADLTRARQRTAKALERVNLELELVASHETAAPAAAAAAAAPDRPAVRSALARLTEQLTFLEGGSRPGVIDDPEQRAAATGALTTLLGPCLKCHELDGARLAPVSAARGVFQHAVFTHRPHVGQVDCLTCHGAIPTSKLATDLVVPGVTTCQQCHAPSQARSDCQACHTYHPPSVARLLDIR